MDESNDMEQKQKFEQNVKNYLKAMDKIQLDLVKMLEESMKLNEILQEAVAHRAERYLEQDNQRIPREIKSHAGKADYEQFHVLPQYGDLAVALTHDGNM